VKNGGLKTISRSCAGYLVSPGLEVRVQREKANTLIRFWINMGLPGVRLPFTGNTTPIFRARALRLNPKHLNASSEAGIPQGLTPALPNRFVHLLHVSILRWISKGLISYRLDISWLCVTATISPLIRFAQTTLRPKIN